MPKEELYCGLDIGSGRITAVLGKYNEETEKIEIFAGEQEEDRNAFTAGVIKDTGKASELLGKVISKIESVAKTNKLNLIIGVRGRFINTFNTHAQIPITSTDKLITIEDQERVIDHAIKSLRISSEREIIDVIPQDYIIDGQPGIKNPVDMEGSMLELDAHVVVAYCSFLRNIERALALANYTPERIVYSLVSVSELVTEEEERNLGSLVIDFNGQTTGVVIYSGGHIRFCKEFYSNEIDIGSDLITREISSYYKTSWNIAENIKKQYGAAKPSIVKKDEPIPIPSRDGKTMKNTTRKELSRIIAEVLETLFLDKIIPELKTTNLLEQVLEAGEIVVTGGGGNLFGITEAIRDLFSHECNIDVSVRAGNIGPENGIIDNEEIISNFSYITAISLIKYEVSRSRKLSLPKYKSKKSGIFRAIKKIWNWFE